LERSGAGKETVLPPDPEPHIGAESKYEKIKTASNYEIDTPVIVDGSGNASEAGVDGIVLFIFCCSFFSFPGIFLSFFLSSFFLLGRPTLQRKTRQYIEK
jgi:hypothetical protein